MAHYIGMHRRNGPPLATSYPARIRLIARNQGSDALKTQSFANIGLEKTLQPQIGRFSAGMIFYRMMCIGASFSGHLAALAGSQKLPRNHR